jgi:hypothetical protein
MTREEQLEDMLRRLLGEETRDVYLRPGEYELVQEARNLLTGEGADLHDPTFTPDGILDVVGVSAESPAPAAPPSAPPGSPEPPELPPEPANPEDPPYVETPPPARAPAVLIELARLTFPLVIGIPSAFKERIGPRLQGGERRAVVHGLHVNAPCVGFGALDVIMLGNVHILWDRTRDLLVQPDLADFGTDTDDANGFFIDSQPLRGENLISVRGTYSGIVPEGYALGDEYTLTMVFRGEVS